jgi:hypothetical protein
MRIVTTTTFAGRYWCVVAGAALALPGCGHAGSDRCDVTGTVTLAGQPVDGGNIEFAPLAASQGSASGAMIQAGRYTIPSKTGLSPGKYRVRIYWADKPTLVDADESDAPPGAIKKNPARIPQVKELIPAKYNVESQLTIDVRQDGGNTFDFALER